MTSFGIANSFKFIKFNAWISFINSNNKDLYLNKIFKAYWKYNLDITNNEILIGILKECEIDKNNFFEGIKNVQIKNKLKK